VVDEQLDNAVDALADGVEQRVANVDAVLAQQQLHDLHVLVVHRDLNSMTRATAPSSWSGHFPPTEDLPLPLNYRRRHLLLLIMIIV